MKQSSDRIEAQIDRIHQTVRRGHCRVSLFSVAQSSEACFGLAVSMQSNNCSTDELRGLKGGTRPPGGLVRCAQEKRARSRPPNSTAWIRKMEKSHGEGAAAQLGRYRVRATSPARVCLMYRSLLRGSIVSDRFYGVGSELLARDSVSPFDSARELPRTVTP